MCLLGILSTWHLLSSLLLSSLLLENECHQLDFRVRAEDSGGASYAHQSEQFELDMQVTTVIQHDFINGT